MSHTSLRFAAPAASRRLRVFPVLAFVWLLLGPAAARGQFRPALFLEELTVSDAPA